jgi:hypothetical protein
MFRLACIAVAALMLGDADIPVVLHWKPAAHKQALEFPPDQNLPLFPAFEQVNPPAESKKAQNPAQKPGPIQPESRLAIVRYVSGEFARAIKPLPAGKKGFRLIAGKPVDEKALRQAVAIGGPAVNAGDQVQITRIEFHGHEIIFDLNGGGRSKTRWRDRISIGMAGSGPTPGVSMGGGGAAPGYQGTGATVFLDFGRDLPDITPDELKELLGGILDFSKQRSAAVQWVQTLPPELQQAIRDKHVVVGMSQDMVVAALGKPERKVRERDTVGNETEDWIYGRPPDKMTFVTFRGDKVVRVREYNN